MFFNVPTVQKISTLTIVFPPFLLANLMGERLRQYFIFPSLTHSSNGGRGAKRCSFMAFLASLKHFRINSPLSSEPT